MTDEMLIYLVLAGLAGGFINGLAGFGTSLFALGFLLQILPAVQAVGLVLVLSVFSGLQGLWIVRQKIFENPKRLLPYFASGNWYPYWCFQPQLYRCRTIKDIYWFIYAVLWRFFCVAGKSAHPVGSAPMTDRLVGLIGGILGGAAGFQEQLLRSVWLSMRPYSKNETRAVLQPFNVSVLGLSIIMLILNGAYSLASLIHLAVIMPAGLVATHKSASGYLKGWKRPQFRRLLIIMMFVSGLILILRSLFGL